MPFKDITAAIGPGRQTDIDGVHYLEAQVSELEGILADPREFLRKNNLPVTAQSQVQTTVVRRPPVATFARIVGIIVAHFRNCDTVIIIFVA